MTALDFAPFATLHQRLFAAAYRLHEAELGFVARLPQIMRRHRPDWPAEIALGLDIGAGLGPYCLHMLGYCRKVLAVEPNKAQATYLRRTLGARLLVAEAAVSDHPGKAFLVDDRASGPWRRPLARLSPSAGQAWQQACDVETVDRLVEKFGLAEPQGALVAKIDVEGHELAVLRGMTQVLHRRPALLLIEIEPRHNSESHVVFDVLATAGFTCWRYEKGHLLPASHRDAEDMAGGPPARFSRFSGYRNNFIFLR